MIPNVLSIAGSDPSGGAGIQADLKTFGALDCYGMAVITALTAQNTRGVTAVHLPPPDFVAAQIDAIFADIAVAAVKIGMLGTGAIVEAVAGRLASHKPLIIILDPVLVATSGDRLGSDDVVAAMWQHLIPLASLVTPNLPEAARLSGLDHVSADAMAANIVARGAKAVLVKGGHADTAAADDLLFDGTVSRVFSGKRFATQNTHGTGCTLSAAIAAYCAKGLDLNGAVAAAKTYVSEAIAAADTLSVGHGHGPLHHFHAAGRVKR